MSTWTNVRERLADSWGWWNKLKLQFSHYQIESLIKLYSHARDLALDSAKMQTQFSGMWILCWVHRSDTALVPAGLWGVRTGLREERLFHMHMWELHFLCSWLCFPSESPVESMENFLLVVLGQDPDFYLLFISLLPHWSVDKWFHLREKMLDRVIPILPVVYHLNLHQKYS